MSDFTSEKLRFPVNFDLKVIMDSGENEDVILNIFLRLKISGVSKGSRLSSKGKYVSFTFNITLENREKMDALYSELKKEPGVRFAV